MAIRIIDKTPDLVSSAGGGLNEEEKKAIDALLANTNKAATADLETAVPGGIGARINSFKQAANNYAKSKGGQLGWKRAEKPGLTREDQKNALTATVTFWAK